MSTSSILNATNLQIWDNAAFDDVAPLQPISLNLDDPIKENRSPSRSKPKPKPGAGDIDAEIAEIEGEISRLSKKLEALKIKKARTLAASKTPTPGPTKRGGGGRIIPAKFLNLETPPPPPPPRPLASSSKKTTTQESGRRRGLSLGPMDIYRHATPFRAPPKPSFQKLGGIKEEEKSKEKEKEKETGKEKNLASARRRGMSLGPSEILRRDGSGRSLSISPKTRKPMNSRVSELRKGISTVLPKKSVKMDEGSISGIIKPKTLFEEKKRPLKNAKVRIVASRYDEAGNKRRKWSLPEDNEKKVEEKSAAANRKKRALSLGGVNAIRLKEEMEMERTPPPSITKIAEGLPKIRTLRGVVESPRDSGCAKRVAELVGRKSCFAEDDKGSRSSSCQSLSFEEDGED